MRDITMTVQKGKRAFKTKKQAAGFIQKLPYYGYTSKATLQKIENKSPHAKRKFRYEVTWKR